MSKVSIKELAEKCGVAVSTVSRAMNDREGVSARTRQRILAVAQEIGYVPNASARSLKISAEQSVAVIIQGRTSELLIGILSDLRGFLREEGFEAFLQHVPDDEATIGTVERIVRERKPSGLVFLGRYGDSGDGNTSTVSRQLDGLSTPLVYSTTADFSGPPARHSSVSIDDIGGAVDLTRHLLEQGHRRIGFACVKDGEALSSHHAWALRYRGFRQAMEDAGVAVDESLIVPSLDPVELYSMANGYASVKAWLADTDPQMTALVTSCDAIGLGASKALKESGRRIPDDCAITAFDGLDFAQYCDPSLTTVVQPRVDIARETARVLADAIADPRHPTEQKWIRGEIRFGESTMNRI